MKRIMFVCTGNSARSQMAEGLAKSLAGKKWEVRSAGLYPKGVNALAIQVMREIGMDISSQESKSIDTKLLSQMDVVVTLCDNAKESCPLIPCHIKTYHWSLPDPSSFSGSEEEIAKQFGQVRDEIRRRINKLLGEEI